MVQKILSFAAIAALFLAGAACADGGIAPVSPYATVFAPEQKAAISWDGSTEKMVLSTKIVSNDSLAMAWIIPIQSSTAPKVEKSDATIFYELTALFYSPPVYEKTPFGQLAAGAKPPEVVVVQSLKVDLYDVAVLNASDAGSLLEWLNGNGFYFPENRKSVLDYYFQKGGYYFVANKINFLNQYPNATIGENEAACAAEIGIYPPRYGFGAEEALANADSQIASQYAELPECANASLEPVKALVKLREGIATPLELTFTPEKPFYPMEISAMNGGNTLAGVYVFGKTCFSDSSGLLEYKNAVQNSTLAEKQGFAGANCVSFLQYDGPNSALAGDSFFVEKPFSPEYDPGYVAPRNFVEEFAPVAAGFLLLLAVAVLPTFVVGALTAHFAAKNKKNRKRAETIRKIGLALLACAILVPAAAVLVVVTSASVAPDAVAVVAVLLVLYSVFPAGGFASGYFAVKNKKWWIAPAGLAALAALALIITADALLLGLIG